jgi:hypothetical protein
MLQSGILKNFTPTEVLYNTSMLTLSTIISGITSKVIKTFSEKEAGQADTGGYRSEKYPSRAHY